MMRVCVNQFSRVRSRSIACPSLVALTTHPHPIRLVLSVSPPPPPPPPQPVSPSLPTSPHSCLPAASASILQPSITDDVHLNESHHTGAACTVHVRQALLAHAELCDMAMRRMLRSLQQRPIATLRCLSLHSRNFEVVCPPGTRVYFSAHTPTTTPALQQLLRSSTTASA
jgi:hypothetical protein